MTNPVNELPNRTVTANCSNGYAQVQIYFHAEGYLTISSSNGGLVYTDWWWYNPGSPAQPGQNYSVRLTRLTTTGIYTWVGGSPYETWETGWGSLWSMGVNWNAPNDTYVKQVKLEIASPDHAIIWTSPTYTINLVKP